MDHPSSSVPRTIARHEISLVKFEPNVPETFAQHAILNLNTNQIKAAFKFIKLGHAMILLYWWILIGVK